MAIKQGTLFKVFVKESGGNRAIANLRSNSVNFETETIDITNKSSNNWAKSIPSYRSFTMDADGLVDFDAGGTEKDASDMLDAYLNQSTLRMVSTDEAVGSPTFEADFFITSYTITASHDGAVEFSLTLQGDGVMTIGTVS